MADPKYRIYPQKSCDQLAADLAAYPHRRLKTWNDGTTRWIQVIPDRAAATAAGVIMPTDDPPPIDDSFVCPGSPLCPPT